MKRRTAGLLLWVVLVGAPEVKGQNAPAGAGIREAYLRAVATYFRTSFREVEVLAAWDIPSQEVPAVLYLAARAGVSPDVVVSLRRDGMEWRDAARRLGVEPLEPDLVTGVNVRFLSRELGASPAEILRAFREDGDFVTVHHRLGRPGAP